jgi:hypothetical protein
LVLIRALEYANGAIVASAETEHITPGKFAGELEQVYPGRNFAVEEQRGYYYARVPRSH